VFVEGLEKTAGFGEKGLLRGARKVLKDPVVAVAAAKKTVMNSVGRVRHASIHGGAGPALKTGLHEATKFGRGVGSGLASIAKKFRR
jgi:hypothetical protein